MQEPAAESLAIVDNPLVRLSAEAYNHLLAVSFGQVSSRVSIFGFAEVVREDNVFIFNRVILPSQVATLRQSFIGNWHAACLALLDECRWRGLDQEKLGGFWIMSPLKKMACWTPEQLDDELADGFPFRSAGFMVSILWNRQGEMLARADIFDPRKTFLNVPVEISTEPEFTTPLPMALDFSVKVRKVKRIRKGGQAG